VLIGRERADGVVDGALDQQAEQAGVLGLARTPIENLAVLNGPCCAWGSLAGVG
jgi:hypothetical protein